MHIEDKFSMNCQAQCLYTFTLWRPWANELLAGLNRWPCLFSITSDLFSITLGPNKFAKHLQHVSTYDNQEQLAPSQYPAWVALENNVCIRFREYHTY